MAINKKFIAGVGRTFNYDANDNLLWVGKTLLNSAIDITSSQQELRAGIGNSLQMVYFHSGKLELTQEEQQFNLTMIANSIGSTITTGGSVWVEETVTVTGGAGSVLGTPIATSTGTVYGWVEQSDGTTQRITFSTKSFSGITQQTGNVCVRYYATNSAARVINVNANIIPNVVRTVIEAQMFSGDTNNASTSTLVGKVLVEVPRLQLDGSAKLNLTSTGVSSTPIKGTALASTVAGCSSSGIYATITEVLDSANWYDDVFALALTVDPITLTTAISPLTVDLRAIPTNGLAFKPPYGDITWATSDATKFTVSNGVLTKVAAGSANLNYTITGKTSITGQTVVTVS